MIKQNRLMVQNIERLSISLNTKMDESRGKLDELATAQLSMPNFQHFTSQNNVDNEVR